jgi:hypothetical protein
VLYVFVCNPAGKMLYLHALLPKLSHFAVAKYTLLHAERHLAQCALFAWLQTLDIPASSGTTFYFSQ